jgi:hypothetical protein
MILFFNKILVFNERDSLEKLERVISLNLKRLSLDLSGAISGVFEKLFFML